MSSLKVQQIRGKLLGEFQTLLDLSDIGVDDADRESKVLSRCLAAFAIQQQTGCSSKDAADSVWDGSDDNGIDAAAYDPSDSRIVFVQAKWIKKGAGEPPADDVGTFIRGVKDVVEQDQTGFHKRLHPRFSDLALRINTPGTSVHIVLASTGASQLARHAAKILEDFLSELNGDDTDAIASTETLGLSEIYSGLANDSTHSTVTLDATLTDWSYVATPYAAYVGTIDGFQLKTWWKTHGRSLVSANIRHSLGSTDVNNEIKQTAVGSPEKFWYFNNGITLVAEDKAKAPLNASSRTAGVFTFKGASIVNGAQTVSSLAKVDQDASLANVKVSIRVILLQGSPDGFGNEVTRTNNLQNRIELRDFVAQDSQQNRLRQEMAIEGVDYQFVRSDDSIATATSCELVEVTTALACASGDSILAVQIKTGIGRFFGDLKKAPYRTLFNPSTSGAKAFNATLMLRKIEEWIDQEKRKISKKSGPPWGVLVHGNRVLASAVFVRFGVNKLTQPITDFQKVLGGSSAELTAICSIVHARMADGVEKHYPSKFLAVLFKNPTMSKHLFDLAVDVVGN